MQIKIDINVCRVCLKSEATCAPLFGDTDYATKFTFTTQLQATKGDGLPELLCTKCVARLKIAHEFRTQAESSQSHLRKFIADVNNKFTEVTANELDEQQQQLQDDVDKILAEALDAQLPAKTEPVGTVAASQVATRSSARKQTVAVSKASPPEQEKAKIFVKLKKPATTTTTTTTAWIKDEMENDDAEVEAEPISNNDDHEEVATDDEEDLLEEFHCDDEPDSSEYNGSLVNKPPAVAPSTIESDEEMQEEHLEIEHFDFDQADATASPPPLTNVGATALPPRKRRARRKAKLGEDAEEEAHICAECNKDFSTRTNLLRHMNTHAGVKPYTCQICGNSFTQNGSLKQHMHIHTGDRPYQCEFCSRGFTQAKSLVFHMRRHTGEKPFKCSKCNLSFRQKDGLKRHMAVRHSTEPKSAWSCDTCGKILQSKYSMTLHMRKHLSEPTSAEDSLMAFPCDQCMRSFHTKTALVAHERTHAMLVIIRCKLCEREFANRAQLAEHELTHTRAEYVEHEEREATMFECTVCSTLFSQQSHLNAHMSMQHNERAKKFMCAKCPKSYAIEKNLAKHLRIHDLNSSLEYVEEDQNEDEDLVDETMDVTAEGENDDDEVVVGDDDNPHDLLDIIQQCTFCSIGFISRAALREHHVAEHPDEKLPVDDDEEDGDDDDDTPRLLPMHDAIEATCDECDKKFASQRLFDEHQLEHDLTGK